MAVRKYRVVLAACLLAVTASQALASADWLLTQQQSDGAISSSADTATSVQSTAESISSLRLLGRGSSATAQAYLSQQTYHGTEYLSRKIIAAVEGGFAVDALLAELTSHQNADGGFGELSGYQSTTLDTAFALEALAAARPEHAAVGQGTGFILQAQGNDGGWSLGSTSSDVYVTAIVARALYAYRNRFIAVPSVVAKAGTFLLSRRGGDALWGEDVLSAQALLTLSTISADVSVLQQSSVALKARRAANTSWNGDVYATAVALRALYVYDARAGGATTPISGGAVTGYVLRSGTSEPIFGASISSTGGVQAQTNAEGYFVLNNVAAGATTLTIQKGGYAPATRAVTVHNGQFSNAGTVLLAQSVQQALIRGHLTDAHDGSALAGVSIALSGAGAATTSNAAGEFELAGVTAGTYTITFQRAGYHTVAGTIEAPSGSITGVQQALTREGAFLDTSSVNVSGRVVDGLSNLPIAGAQLRIDGVGAASSQADGTFVLSSVSRGDHRLEVNVGGYAAAVYSFILPPGAAGTLGDLALFASTPDAAATTLTLAGLVVDGLSNLPLPGAAVRIVQSNTDVQADSAGRFTLADIATLTFDVTISAAGHETRTYAVSASGFGEVAGTFALPPAGGDPTAISSTLRGVVRDSVSNDPLPNVSLRVVGTSVVAVSDASGAFELTGISAQQFELVAATSGYTQRSYDIEIAQHGTYAVDVSLTREPGAVDDLFDVVSVVAIQTNTGANTQQRFAARITNLSSDPRTALVVADILDAAGIRVATVTPFAAGTTTPTTVFGFAANESLDLTIPWAVAQFAPGTYRVQVRVVEPDTVTRDLPSGVVLARGDALAAVVTTQTIGGGLALDPPLAQSGSSQPVRLAALLSNEGNIPLVSPEFVLSVLDPDSGATLHSARTTVGQMEVGGHSMVDFGTWVPTRAGDMPVSVTASNAQITGIVNDVLYVGDKATGAFTVDRSIVPMGTQQVRASVSMRGVDVRTGTSTDPLFLAVREAVRKGGVYVAQQAPLWNEQNRCLGCHTQTQSIMGLAASVGKADIDLNAIKYLYNDIVGSSQSNGGLYATHPQHASVQNAMAMWSLSAWPDAEQVFRTMYRAGSFQMSRLSTSGNQSWWASDHCGGWWCNNEGPTMAATKGIAGLLRMADELGSQSVTDYALVASHDLGGVNVMDMEQTADGMLWYVEYAGTLSARNLQTGERRTVASGITNAYGLAVRDDNVAYVTSGSRIHRVAADGTRTVLVDVGGNANLLDIVIGSDGFLYVTDFTNHRILRVSQAGTASVFVSGGLFTQPVGLAFDPQGDLYVANFGRFNILRVTPAGQVSVFAPGLPYRPVWLRRGADGTFYANSETYNNSGSSPSGVWSIDTNGRVERLAVLDSTNLYNYSALTLIDGEVFVTHEPTRRLQRLTSQPLATPELAAMRSAMERVVRFTLARYTDNGQWNDIHAMRLITLAEARPYIADTALRSQIDTAITAIANLLRQRQRADGGWAYIVSRTVSDPYATAFVGLALEYTNPSVNDPAIRNSITYLLNQQQADFSWNFQTGVFPTKLGPTSFVMAYLPIALERLGGIDVDLSMVLPSNVTLSNPSHTPTVTAVNGGTRYDWSLQGVTANARTVSFDATLPNMGYQEERALALEAHLEFSNSFTEETLRSDLPIPKVRAASDLVLTLSTGQSTYGANSDVAITSTVTNAGPQITSGEVRLSIRAADGSTIADLGSIAVGPMATGATLPFPSNWNTGAVLAGGYQVQGQLFNQTSALVSEAVTSFQVAHEGAVVGANVSSDRPAYAAWDVVELTGRIRNTSINVIQPGSTAELVVRTPAGETLFTRSFDLGSMVPRALRDVTASVTLSDVASGSYPVDLIVRDAFSRVVLATATTQFQVQREALQALQGRVTVQHVRIERGAVNACTDTINNVASTALNSVVLTQALASLDANETLQTTDVTRDFGAGQQHVLLRGVSTSNLTPGAYACVLSATYQGQTRQLGAVGFEVVPPSIRIETTFDAGSRGRLLVLVDRPASPANPGDPFSGSNTPDLNTQRAHLRSVLDAAGWSYTIVDTAEDFEREFNTGGYEVFAILSEVVKLSVELQNRVVDAVNEGKGLFVAGNHDRRNSKLEEALGIKSQGRNLDVSRLIVSQSPVMNSGSESITLDPYALEMRLEGATRIAQYQLSRQVGNAETAAATRYEFGEGRSVYVSMDITLAGAAAGDDSLFAQLFVNALDYIHPETIAARVNRVLPLRIQLTNVAVATGGRVLVTLPAGVTVIDGGQTTVLDDGRLEAVFALDSGEELELSLWVRLPPQTGDYVFRALVQTGAAPDYVNHDEEVITIRAAP